MAGGAANERRRAVVVLDCHIPTDANLSTNKSIPRHSLDRWGHRFSVRADGKAYNLQKVIIPAGSDLGAAGAAMRQVTRSGSDLGADGPTREGPRVERSVTVEDEFDALADALERARALDSGPPPRKSELQRHFSKKPSREGGRRAAEATPSREGGRRPQKPPSRSGSDRAVLGAPAAAGAARGYWLDRSNEGRGGTMTDGRRGSATYWRDRAAATEKPSRGRDQGRKVSPKRDQSGKPAKRDRRRREAGLFTL